MFLILLIGVLALSVLVAVGLYRKLVSNSRHQDSVSLDTEEDLLEVSFVFGNQSGKVDTPNTSDVFAEMVTFQSSVGDEHSLLLRQSKQRSLLSRLKLSGLKPKKADVSKVIPERSLGDTSMEESFEVTQIPKPRIPPVKAQEPRLESSVESEGTEESIELGETQIPRLALDQDKEPADSSESDVTAMEVTQIPAPRTSRQGKGPIPRGRAPESLVKIQVPPSPGQGPVPQPLPRQRKPAAKILSDAVTMSSPSKSGIEDVDQEQAPRTRTKAEVSPQQSEDPENTLESSLAKEKVKLSRKFLMHRRPRSKPSQKPIRTEADRKLAQQPALAELGSESDREEGPGSRSLHPTDLTPKKLQRVRKSKVKAADGKGKLKDPSRKMNAGVKTVEEQEVDEAAPS